MKRRELHKIPGAKVRCHIYVGSHEVPVWDADLTKAGGMFGLAFDDPEPEIWINSKATRQQQARALVHEAVEVINNVYQIGLSETQVRIMEQCLCQSFRITRRGKGSN